MNLMGLVMIVVALRVFTLNFSFVGASFFAPALLAALFFAHVLQTKDSLSNKVFLGGFLVKFNLCMLVLFSFSVWVSFLNGFDALESFATVLRYLIISFLCYFGYIHGFNSASLGLEKVFVVVLLPINLVAVTSVFGFGRFEIVEGVVRPVGLVGYSEVMSHLSLFSALFSLYLFVRLAGRLSFLWVFLNVLLLLLSLLSLVLSSTLKNVLMLPPGILMLLYFSGVSAPKLLRTIFVCFALCIPIFAYFGGAVYERVVITFATGVPLGLEEGDVVESSLAFRLLHWKLLLDDWYGSYFYFGAGSGSVPDMKGFGHYRGFRLDAHSDVVKFLCEYGIVGFSAFLLLFLSLLKRLKRILPDVPVASFCLSCILTFVVVGFFGKVFFSAFNLYFLSILIGYAFGQAKYKELKRSCAV